MIAARPKYGDVLSYRSLPGGVVFSPNLELVTMAVAPFGPPSEMEPWTMVVLATNTMSYEVGTTAVCNLVLDSGVWETLA